MNGWRPSFWLRPGFWRHPVFWLVAQAIAADLWLTAWRPFAAVTHPDSVTYSTALDGPSLRQDLSQRRTLGYPMVLTAVERLTGEPAHAAHLQLALYLVAVIGFGLAAGVYLGSGWGGLAAATPLFWGRLVWGFASALLSDLLAAAFALAAVACLLLLTALPRLAGARRLAAWIGAAVAVFAAYQTRPAYLFLVPLLPLLGLALTLLRQGSRDWRAALQQPAAGLCAVAALPFLGWCGLRWAVTGHFGLVGAGGTNLIGIASSMLDPDLVRELPREHRQAFFLFANRRFTALSLAVIRSKPALYARWVRDSVVLFAKRMAEARPLRYSALLLAASAVAAAPVRGSGRWRGMPAWARIAARPSARGSSLALATVAYAAGSALVVVLVEWPIDRYVFAAELLLPSGLLALAADLWRSTFLGRP